MAIVAYPRIACDRRQKKVARQWYTLPVGERWVNPLPDGASRVKWEPEKKTRFTGLFFLTGLRPVFPSVSAHPAKVLLCTQNVCTKVPLALGQCLPVPASLSPNTQRLTTQQQLRTT